MARSRGGRHSAAAAAAAAAARLAAEDDSPVADLGAGTAPANAASALRCRSSYAGVDPRDGAAADADDHAV